jgi:putative restriction endonuclease
MEKLKELLKRLPDQHRLALGWFIEHADSDQPWPAPLPNGTLLVTRAKGIYKPNWSRYALSVRQTLNGPYQDLEPIWRPDGTWAYSYFQENMDPSDRDASYANLALLACCQDKVPIGVMRQVTIKPYVRYHIVGLALVSSWENGYFFLEGFSKSGDSFSPGPRAEIDVFVAEYEATPSTIESFHPHDILDGRKKTISTIVQRQGQPDFRRKLLEAYNGRCAISEYNVIEALEAAHIIPYRGPQTNHPSNGLLLRADLHTLFDLGLIAIDTKNMAVIISPSLIGTAYHKFVGKVLHLPQNESVSPSREALNEHRTWTGL